MDAAVESAAEKEFSPSEKKAARRRKRLIEALWAFATIAFFIVIGTLVIHYNEVNLACSMPASASSLTACVLLVSGY
jgi:hypothetical protein